MPKVIVFYDPRVISERDLERLERHLAAAVADAFNCTDEGGSLVAKGVDVYYTATEPRSSTEHPLTIDVEANYFPSRHVNFPDRAEQLARAIKAILGTTKFGLWPKLVNANWITSDDIVDN